MFHAFLKTGSVNNDWFESSFFRCLASSTNSKTVEDMLFSRSSSRLFKVNRFSTCRPSCWLKPSLPFLKMNGSSQIYYAGVFAVFDNSKVLIVTIRTRAVSRIDLFRRETDLENFVSISSFEDVFIEVLFCMPLFTPSTVSSYDVVPYPLNRFKRIDIRQCIGIRV